MFWTIFLAVFSALCLFKLMDDVNPVVLLLKLVYREDKRGDLSIRPAIKVLALVGVCVVILIASLGITAGFSAH